MLKHMTPQKKKVDINTSLSKPQHISLLSPVIDDSYNMSKSTTSGTP